MRRPRACSPATLCLLAALSGWPGGLAAQFTASVPKHLTEACELPRTRLETRTTAHNPEVYPQVVDRVEGGWLVYDRYARQVIELDDGLRKVRTWGRRGPGPAEYERPIAMARVGPDRIVVVDRSPPSIMFLGADPTEHAIALGAIPVDAIVGEGEVLFAGRDGSLYRTPLEDPQQARVVRSPQELGVVRTEKGALPIMEVARGGDGRLYAAFKGPSTIWSLATPPRQLVQRCVPESLERVHEEAPTVEVPGFGKAPYTVETLQDFLVLESGRLLTVGGLRIGETGARSLELYDPDGRLIRAWTLDRPKAQVRFAGPDPRRLLIWKEEGMEGVQLVEVSGEEYPER